MFHFCIFFYLSREKEQNMHTNGKGCYYLLFSWLTERGKSLPAVCKMPVSCRSRRSKVVVSLKCWRKGLRRSCLLLSQACHLCRGLTTASRWHPGGKHSSCRMCHNHPEMPALLCCQLIPNCFRGTNLIWSLGSLAASKTLLNYKI